MSDDQKPGEIGGGAKCAHRLRVASSGISTCEKCGVSGDLRFIPFQTNAVANIGSGCCHCQGTGLSDLMANIPCPVCSAETIPAPPAQSLREKIDHNCKTTGDWRGRNAHEIAMNREDVPDTESDEVAPPAVGQHTDAEFGEAVWLAQAYSLSSRDHTKLCLPNVSYPGLGKQDDRCHICKRMDEFMNNQWRGRR